MANIPMTERGEGMAPPAPACRVCGAELDRVPRYAYEPPFICPRNHCPEHGFIWEQASEEKGG